MVGRDVKNEYLNQKISAEEREEILFSAKNITRADGTCKNISFDVHKGEILGFAGLIGLWTFRMYGGNFWSKAFKEWRDIL